MRKREATFGILFRHWVMANAASLISCTFELKQTTTNSIPFSAIEEHQIEFSQAILHSKKGVLIRNESGTTGAPDYSFYRESPAYIVIRYPDGFVIIDVDTFVLEKKRSLTKSLKYSRAKELSTLTIDTRQAKAHTDRVEHNIIK